jgi:uncharacterized repeat protein (TIGR01451 family)
MVKKNYVKIILIVTAIFLSVFMLIKAYAADPKYLEITREREGNQAYKITNLDPNKTIWKIVQYDSMDAEATINYDEAIYCINPEIGFGSNGDVGPLRREYNVSFNMKDLTGVDEIYTNMFSNTNKYNYNALLWIIDNMYLPKQTPETDRVAMKQLLLSKAGITRDVLTDNDIETVQQLALWYYSTEDTSVYHFEPENFPSITIVDTTDESEIAIEEIGQPLENTGIQRKNDMVTLYTYLIDSALEHAAEYGTGNVRQLIAPDIEITKPTGTTPAVIEEVAGTEYFISGPYNFDEVTSTQLPYSFKAFVLDQDDEEITNYVLLDEDKTVMTENEITQAIEGQDFYLAIPTTDTETGKIKFKVEVSYFTTEVSCWTNSETYLVEQPVVIIEKDPHVLSAEVEVEIVREEPEFDLSLRKFITKVNNINITNRVPNVDVTGLVNKTRTTAVYTHPKNPVVVQNGDIVTYTIRVYNEGDLDGYAKEITDDIPEGLEFIISNPVNIEYMWRLSEDGTKISTAYLSRETDEENLISGFDPETMTTLDYKDVQVAFKVIEPNTSERVLTNIAEITNDSDENGQDITDRDSTPANLVETEDDIDKEHLKLEYFDLALRKFITKVNDTEVTDRVPVVSMGENANLKYTHKKDPILVANSDIVIYTIRVYNEGSTSGYAEEVTDDIPVGLSYLPEHETNKKYGWELSEDAKKISTTYLSKQESEEREEDNLLKAFDRSAEISDEEEALNPDYRDIQVAFKVTEKNLPTDRIIINTAEITDDADKDGNDVTDIDSIPDNWEEDEDDIDKEYLRVKYFDLALLKWVSKVYITEDGKTTVKDTGHTGLENPEPIVKVDLDRKNLNKVTVKFGYTIKITNEGEIAGYAKEVSDYIPEGLEFVKEDNPNWEEKDGKIVTRALENTLLQPGESATVEVILKWKNSSENLGLKVNVAEISEDYNEKDAKDIDSTPNNKKDGEDDIDDAPVMLAIKTGGEAPVYYTLSTAVLLIIGSGLFLIKKYVLG